MGKGEIQRAKNDNSQLLRSNYSIAMVWVRISISSKYAIPFRYALKTRN